MNDSKISLEIDLEPHLTAEELREFRRQCEAAQVRPENRIVDMLRELISESLAEEKAAAS